MSERFRREWFEQSLRTRAVGREFRYQIQTTSTMDDARAAAQEGAAHGLVVLAEEQSAGRGRRPDRHWLSPAFQNLTFTILVRPNVAQLRRLSIVTPVALANAVEQLYGLYPRIKWPNDVQLRGHKLAGILIEAEWSAAKPDFALVGIGINVNFEPGAGAGLDRPATSIALEKGRPVPREPLLAAVLNAFERAYQAADSAALFAGWRSRSATLGREVTITGDDGRAFVGLAEDVDEDGALVVRLEGGERRRVHSGAVTLRVARPARP